jgi:S-DNA-T family DNA segregation ATPase FtsK/SpoIIIE
MKANIPARIAFQAPSPADSRAILDTVGAEKLFGAGDTLFLSGELANLVRLQAPYISEDEIKRLVKEWVKKYPKQEEDQTGITTQYSYGQEDDEYNDEDMYEQAKELVIETEKVSTSFLQRKLSIGYSRSARLVDMLEDRGVIGPVNGAKPREILIKK